MLAQHGVLEAGAAHGPGVQCWRVALFRPAHTPVPLSLHVYAEHTLQAPPARVHCDACRVTGWAHHPVTCTTFHFIVPADSQPPPGACPACAAPAPPDAALCPACGASQAAPPHVFESTRHRLHGVLHAHGYGHLLRLCGREAGSARLSGAALLSLWDALCAGLRARSVSVEDVSTKAGLPLRLLHGAAHGQPWYAAAGYAFGRGGFGISRAAHRRALETLHRAPLPPLRAHFARAAAAAAAGGAGAEGAEGAEGADGGGEAEVEALLQRYDAVVAAACAAARHGSGRPRRLLTLGELLQLLLGFYGGRGAEAARRLVSPKGGGGAEAAPAASAPGAARPSDAAGKRKREARPPATARWPPARLAAAAAAAAAALASIAPAEGPGWVHRSTLRCAARELVLDSELLDAVLKTLDVLRPPGGPPPAVERRLDARSKQLQFRIAPPAAAAAAAAEVEAEAEAPAARAARTVGSLEGPGREEAAADLHALYRGLFEPGPEAAAEAGPVAALRAAACVVLDTKLFIKDYRGELDGSGVKAWAPPGGGGAAFRPPPHVAAPPPPPQPLRVLLAPALERAGAPRPAAAAGWAGGRPHARRDPPPLLLLLPPGSVVAELKSAASAAFGRTYPCLAGYEVESVEGLAMCGDRARVALRGPAAPPVRAWGQFGGEAGGAEALARLASSPLRFQGGLEAWVVRCACGVDDDDGERMFECARCGIWKHTRCEGLADEEEVEEGRACGACLAGGGAEGEAERPEGHVEE